MYPAPNTVSLVITPSMYRAVLLAGSTTRNECARFSQVIRRFLGIEYQCGVEENRRR